MDELGGHPDPPPDLHQREIPLIDIDQAWFRIHRVDRDPIHFGREAQWRFDSPDRSYGVVYLAVDEHAAFIETFGHVTGVNSVTVSSLSGRHLARIDPARPLRLVDLVSSGGLARLGADARLCTGSYQVSRRWSRALHDHPSRPDGIRYPCRHDPARSAGAVFDHVTGHLSAHRLGSLLTIENGTLLGKILDHYGFGLIDV